MDTNSIEVCFSPALFDTFFNKEAVVIVVDVLRATSAICTAFMNGAKGIIPVGNLDEVHLYKKLGYLIAAERNGIQLDVADFGNSPDNFTKERVLGREIVYSTTNGTMAIRRASDCNAVIVGSFLNVSAVCNWLKHCNRNVIVLCAGWKNKFSLEDALLAGCISEKLTSGSQFFTVCDSAIASMDLYDMAKVNMNEYIDKAAQRTRLKKNELDGVIPFCLTSDITSVIPVYQNGKITDVSLNRADW